MRSFYDCGDDACSALPPSGSLALALDDLASASPYFLLLLLATLAAVRHGYPYLSRAAHDDARDGDDHVLPSHAPAALRQVHAEHGAKSLRRRVVAWTFGVTVGLAAALGALILAEILEVRGRAGRGLALHIVVPALLFLLVGLVPWLECKSLVNGAGWRLRPSSPSSSSVGAGRRIPKFAWLMQSVLFSCWLFAFWKLGRAVPAPAVPEDHKTTISTSIDTGTGSDSLQDLLQALSRACLERIGVVGISLMGLLAGFASVSAIWHTFTSVTGRRRRPVTDADVHRKQTGLDATNEMLLTKRHRLQRLQRKIAAGESSPQPTGLMGKMMGSIRGSASADEIEVRGLRVEIAGLETMEANLASNLALMRGRRAADSRAATVCGRLCLVPSHIFALYCLYRVVATALATLRRVRTPLSTAITEPFSSSSSTTSASFSSSDPVNRVLALVALHWDPALDQAAWSRIISFALSGVILLASANSALQTFHLFARWTPGLLRHAQANLALVVGQVAATYMISASLLMRSQLPLEARSAVGGVLRGALSPVFVDSWFEGWFLTGSAATVLGLWLGRRIGGGRWDEDWDDYGSEEMGAKRM